MRKMSKNRADDDTVSSTNGSVTAEPEATNGGTASDADADADAVEPARDENEDPSGESPSDEVKNDKEDTPPPRDPPKKRAAKSRAKELKKAESENEDEEEYEVEQVVDSKKIRGKLHYLIRWKGYSASSDTWEAADTLSCPDLVKKFEESEKKSPKKALKRKSTASTPKAGGKKGRPSKSPKKGRASKPAKAKKEEFDYESADAEAEYEVEKILEVHHKKNGKREFLIHWKGWSNRYDSWEPEEHLNCGDLIKKFMAKVSSAKDKEQRELRVAPESTRRFTLAQKSTGRRLSKRSNQRQRVRYDGAE